MPRKWSKRERVEHTSERYFELKKKLFLVLVVVAVFILLVYGMIHSAHTGNTIMMGLLVIILIIMVPLSIFILDMLLWESS